MDKIVTRIAPSPTGKMHIGTARTALFNYLLARHFGGQFIIRIEDTDPARDRPEFEFDILENLEWLGIIPDAKFKQSDQNDKHRREIQRLIDAGAAYISSEPSKEDPSKAVDLVRFRNPNKQVTFTDLLHGEITVDTTDLHDFVIARSISQPVHHLAVVVDDESMGVTLAMRGEDLLSNTPRQILIQEALGYKRPQYAHLPLILAPDRTKLSKRRHAVAMGDYREQGYLAAGMVNFLAFLGWNPGTEQEIFSIDELIAVFDISGIQKSPAVFNVEKLRWFNREYLHKIRSDDFAAEALRILQEEIENRGFQWDENTGHQLVHVIKERISIWNDLRQIVQVGELDYFFSQPVLDVTKIPEKKSTVDAAQDHLQFIEHTLPNIHTFSADEIKRILWDYATEKGRGAVLWPFRYALTGQDRTPDPFIVASILGKEETLKRVRDAIQLLSV